MGNYSLRTLTLLLRAHSASAALILAEPSCSQKERTKRNGSTGTPEARVRGGGLWGRWRGKEHSVRTCLGILPLPLSSWKAGT